MANIKLNNNEYPIPDSTLAAPTADFIAHLATIAGNGIRVIVGGVEYDVDPSKVAGAIVELETVLGGLHSDEVKLDPGLYDANDTLVASWEDLTSTYGMDATADYTYDTYKTDVASPYYVLTTHEELADGVKLVIGDIPRIGNQTFRNCTALTHVEINDSVTSIGKSAFLSCSNLKSINIPQDVLELKDSTFYECTSLTSVSLAENSPLQSVGNSAFKGCAELTNFVIPAGVTSIGTYAFDGCTKLSYINIPEGVLKLNMYTFNKCSSLTTVDIGENSQLKLIDQRAFFHCQSLTSIRIPDATTTIGIAAFLGCTNLSEIVLGRGITTINVEAFRDCKGLTTVQFNATNMTALSSSSNIFNNAGIDGEGINVTIGSNVTQIPKYLFYVNSASNPNVVSVTFEEESVCTNIDDYAFSGCRNLATVVIPDSVTRIGARAFDGCWLLTTLDLGNGVATIGENAFYACENLVSVTVPASITSIGNQAFYTCNKLIEVHNLSTLNITAKSTENGYIAHQAKNVYTGTSGYSKLVEKDGYIFYYDTDQDVYYCMGHEDTTAAELVLPDSIDEQGYSLYKETFRSRGTLLSVVLPVTVTSLGNQVFDSCTNLYTITYLGTMAQWEALSKGLMWNNSTPATCVQCSDGQVTL